VLPAFAVCCVFTCCLLPVLPPDDELEPVVAHALNTSAALRKRD
jgi:hypothetical protein